MTDLDVPSEPPAGLPRLTDAELAVLPKRRPVVVALLGCLVGAGLAIALTVVAYPDSPEQAPTADRLLQVAVCLAPWLLTARWLRSLDLRRVPCFFLCLVSPLGGFVVAAVVGYRAVSLPYRTWPVSYWHEHRARRIPGSRAWVLAEAGSVVEPDLSPRTEFWERLERWAWVVMAGSAVTFRVWSDPLDSVFGGLWFASLLALAAAPFVVTWVLRSRAANPRAR